LDQEEPLIDIVIKKKNIFQVTINKNNAIFIETAGEGKVVELEDVRKMAVAFIDNGQGNGNPTDANPNGLPCNHCQGAKNPLSSDHPEKAIVSLQNDGETAYGPYVEVQNELMAAFNQLRNREAQRLFQRDFTDIFKDYTEKPFSPVRESWKKQLEAVRALYPLKFTEAEAKKN
jgi:hypothetical protein